MVKCFDRHIVDKIRRVYRAGNRLIETKHSSLKLATFDNNSNRCWSYANLHWLRLIFFPFSFLSGSNDSEKRIGSEAICSIQYATEWSTLRARARVWSLRSEPQRECSGMESRLRACATLEHLPHPPTGSLTEREGKWDGANATEQLMCEGLERALTHASIRTDACLTYTLSLSLFFFPVCSILHDLRCWKPAVSFPQASLNNYHARDGD